jgi:hypothetical protein
MTMTGLPKETEKDVIESIEFIDRIKSITMCLSDCFHSYATQGNAQERGQMGTRVLAAAPVAVILNATKISVDMMIERLCRLTS